MSTFDNINNLGFDLKDYKHASKLYLENNYALTPKFKFLYHVVLNINPQAQNLGLTNSDITTINLLAKSVDLPKYRVQVQPIKQYNRNKLVQTGVQYDPISIEYHDDSRGLTTLLWESYFRYYYADSNYTTSDADGPRTTVDAFKRVGQAGLNRVYGQNGEAAVKYGLDRPGKVAPFFDSIQIFQLATTSGTPTFTSFTLVNPIIEMMEHDQQDQTASEFMLNRVTIGYESVQYSRGYQRPGTTPGGFGESTHYDTEPSRFGNRTSPSATSSRSIQGNRTNDFERGVIDSSQTRELQRQSTAPIPAPSSNEVTSANGVILPANNNSSNETVATQRTFV